MSQSDQDRVELEAGLWALTLGGWTCDRASLYDEEGVEGWHWTGPRADGVTADLGEMGAWDDLPPVPDVVVEAYREWAKTAV